MRSKLPAVDKLLSHPDFQALSDKWGRLTVISGIRAVQVLIRENPHQLTDQGISEQYLKLVSQWIQENRKRGYTRVFNLTGTILHTNLGRSNIHPEIFDRVREIATQPASIEFDLQTGHRGDRESSLRERLKTLTGAEDASVVNNNAAAVLIILHALAVNRKVVVSRGELVEIGGSFRLPAIMESAGCELLEVGTTNRTHLADYEQALSGNPALILKVHPSNYRVDGFTKETTTPELAELAKKSKIPLVVDVGSGALFDTRKLGIDSETTPSRALQDGADLVSFSGDKLLGGPQSGIIVGRDDLIEKINSSPMKRALRLYKVSLALLEETLKVYEDPELIPNQINTIRLLSLTELELNTRATRLHQILSSKLQDSFKLRIENCDAEVGSGALPSTAVKSVAVVINASEQQKLEELSRKLRNLSIPVLCRIHKRELYLDMHGAEPLEELCQVLSDLP